MKTIRTFCGIVAAAALALLAGNAQGGTVLLPTSADAHIDGNNPDTNYGTAEVLEIGQTSLGGQKAYLLFDASGWGTTNIARIGEIRIVCASSVTRTYSAHLITGEGVNDWVETEINWTSAPANNVEGTDRNFLAHPGQTVTPLGSISGVGDGSVLTISLIPGSAGVTALLNALNTGDRKATLGIAYNSSQDTTVGFYSKEHGNGSMAAALTIPSQDRILPVVMDAHIDWIFASLNFGGDAVLSLSQHSLGGRKAYLSFDASGWEETPIPRVERIRVYWAGSVNITRTLMLSLLTGTGANDWIEYEINWENAPANNTTTNRGFFAYPGQTVTLLGNTQYVAGASREMNLAIAEDSAAEAALLNALNTGDRKVTIGVSYNSSPENTVGIYSREYSGGINIPTLWLGEKTVVPPSVRWIGFSADQPVLELAGPANVNYTVLSSSNLTDWVEVDTVAVPTPPAQWTDTFNSPAPRRFYKARVE